MPLRNPIKWVWQADDRGLLRIAGIVINTWYPMTNSDPNTLGVIGGGVKVLTVRIRQSNDELAAKNIDLRLTIDGYALAISVAALLNNIFTCIVLDGIVLVDRVSPDRAAFWYSDTGREPFECSTFLGEIQITSAVGTNQQLELELNCSKLG